MKRKNITKKGQQIGRGENKGKSDAWGMRWGMKDKEYKRGKWGNANCKRKLV